MWKIFLFYCPSSWLTPGGSHTNIHISPIKTIQTQTSKKIFRGRRKMMTSWNFLSQQTPCHVYFVMRLKLFFPCPGPWLQEPCWYQFSVVSNCSNNDINKVNNPTFTLFWANIVVHEKRQLHIKLDAWALNVLHQ